MTLPTARTVAALALLIGLCPGCAPPKSEGEDMLGGIAGVCAGLEADAATAGAPTTQPADAVAPADAEQPILAAVQEPPVPECIPLVEIENIPFDIAAMREDTASLPAELLDPTEFE